MREIFDRHNCDKGYRHGYERVYETFFEPVRDKEISLLEIGVFTGASINAWLEYFPNAKIVGVDKFERVPKKEINLIDPSRVELINSDSRDVEFDCEFDFIIDDGSHRFDVQLATFLNLIQYTKLYFIEDHWPLNSMTQQQLNHSWLKQPGFSKKSYNRLIGILQDYEYYVHDLRDGQQPDSCIIEVRNQ